MTASLAPRWPADATLLREVLTWARAEGFRPSHEPSARRHTWTHPEYPAWHMRRDAPKQSAGEGMNQPISFTVTRHRCPHCPRTASSKARIREHMARCWSNPEVRGCKTCAHFEPVEWSERETGYPGQPEGCAEGISLAGRPACERCSGQGEIGMGDAIGGGMSECQTCGGDADEIKPGPIVHCYEWEAKP